MSGRVAHQVRVLLERGSSVALSGTVGSGRSHTLRTVARRIEHAGRPVLTVAGIQGLPPLAAVRIAVPDHLPGRMVDADEFSVLFRALVDRFDGDAPVIVVDDAHRLDRRSWALLGALHRELDAPVLAGLTPDSDLMPWLIETVNPLVLLDLGALSAEAMHAVLEERAGTPVPLPLSVRIHGETGGHPALALAMLDEALRRGVGAAGPVPDTVLRSARLSGMYDATLAGLPTGQRDALHLLGVVGPVPLPAALTLLGGPALAALERQGLVRTSITGAGPTVGVDPPGLADHLRLSTGHSVRYRLALTALTALDGALDDEAEYLRDRLRDLMTPDGDQRSTADPEPGGTAVARALAARVQAQVAEATQRWTERPSTGRAAALLRLLVTVEDEPGRVEHVLARTPRSGDPRDFGTVELCFLQARWHIARGADPGTVTDRLAETLPPGAAPAQREALDSLAIALRAQYGPVPEDYQQVLTPRLRDEDNAGHTARVALAACHAITGRHDLVAELLDVDRQDWPALLRDSADVIAALSRYGSGQLADGLDLARALAESAVIHGSPSSWISALYVSALCLGARMRLDAARRALVPLLATGLRARSLVLAPDRAARVLLATLSLHTQRTGLVPGLRVLAEEQTAPDGALPFGDPLWMTAITLFMAGEPEEGARLLDGLTEREREEGHHLAADTTRIHRLVLAFDPELAAGFRDTAERIGGEAYLTYLDAQQALVRGDDPDALIAAAHRLVALDLREQAIRCLLAAADRLQADGDLVRANRARADAQSLGAPPSVPVDRPGAEALSAREHEVAALYGRGETTGAIADRLLVSRRTVESHLYNIRRKTGARDRVDIARLTETAD